MRSSKLAAFFEFVELEAPFAASNRTPLPVLSSRGHVKHLRRKHLKGHLQLRRLLPPPLPLLARREASVQVPQGRLRPDAGELQCPGLVDGDAEGRGGAVQDHAEAAGVGLHDSSQHRAAGDPRLRRLAGDEVHARGQGHHHAGTAVALRRGPGDESQRCQRQRQQAGRHH